MKNAFDFKRTLLSVIFTLFYLSPVHSQETSTPHINILFFYKSECANCEKLQRQILPELKQRFGNQITILSLNTGSQQGGQLYLSALVDLEIPFSQPLPIVVVEGRQWSDPTEIANQLPDVVETALNNSISGWPAVTGLKDFLERLQSLPESEKSRWFISAQSGTIGFMVSDMAVKFNHDPSGNSYAVVVLISMIIVLGYTLFLFLKSRSPEIDLFSQWIILIVSITGIAITWQLAEMDQILQGHKLFGESTESQLAFLVLTGMVAAFIFNLWALFGSTAHKIAVWQRWIIPLLLAVGFIATGYLMIIQTSDIEAVCGAMGDCNSVQQSKYSSLFGVISVSVLGLLGQGLILSSWVMEQFGPSKWRGDFKILLWGLLLVGVGFFIFLTFLEPFVIGATCFWCITTAVAMTQQLSITVRPAIQAKNKLEVEEV